MRPSCIVCSNEGLLHEGGDIWFCHSKCENYFKFYDAPRDNFFRCKRHGVITEERCRREGGHTGPCLFSTRNEVSYDKEGTESALAEHVRRATVENIRRSRENRILPGQYKGKLEITDQFKHQWPEIARYMDQMNQQNAQKLEHAPAVLTSEEVAQIKGVKMPPENKNKNCVVCKKKLTHNHPGAMFCSSTCGETAANGLKAIQLLHPVADRACRFLSGLNLQDHSVKEQREQVEITNQLVNTLRPKRGKL